MVLENRGGFTAGPAAINMCRIKRSSNILNSAGRIASAYESALINQFLCRESMCRYIKHTLSYDNRVDWVHGIRYNYGLQ